MRSDSAPIVPGRNSDYDGFIPLRSSGFEQEEDIMMRLFPLTWAALNVGLATAATYLLCNTDLLSGVGAIVMFH